MNAGTCLPYLPRRAKQSTSQNVNWQRNVAKLEYRVLTRKAKVGEEESVGEECQLSLLFLPFPFSNGEGGSRGKKLGRWRWRWYDLYWDRLLPQYHAGALIMSGEPFSSPRPVYDYRSNQTIAGTVGSFSVWYSVDAWRWGRRCQKAWCERTSTWQSSQGADPCKPLHT